MLELLAESLTEVIKRGIDSGSVEDVEGAASTLNEVFDLAWYRPDSNEQASSIEQLRSVVVASRFALGGWVLLRLRRSDLDQEHARAMRAAIHPSGAPAGWSVFRRLEGSGETLAPWAFWEVQLEEPAGPGRARASFLQLDHFIRCDVLLDAFARSALPQRRDFEEPNRPQSAIDARVTAEQLVRQVEEMVNDQTWQQLGAIPSQVAQVRNALQLIAEEAQHEEGEALIALPLVPAKVAAFSRAVHRRSEERLDTIRLFDFDEVGETADSGRSSFGDHWIFGTNGLAPKDFFVETDVLADPEHLGWEYGLALLRAEANYVLSQLRATLEPPTTAKSTDFREGVESAISDLGRDADSVVILFGPWTSLAALGLDDSRADGPSGPEPIGRLRNAPVYWEVSTGEGHCVVFDRRRVGRFTWRTLPTEPDEAVDRRGSLLVATRPVTASLARQFINRDEGFLVVDGTKVRADEAVWALQQRVQVRVQEAIRWEPSDRTAGRIVVIEEE